MQKESQFLELEGSPEVARRIAEANKFYKDEYAPKFNEYVGKNFKESIRRDKPWPASDFSRRFLDLQNGANEAVSQLKSIMGSSPDAAKAGKAAEDYIVGVLGEQLYGVKNADAAIAKVDSFVNKKEMQDVLKFYPGVKDRISKFRVPLQANRKQQLS